METLLDPEVIQSTLRALETWLFENVLVVSTLMQVAIVAAAFLIARLLAPRLQRRLESLSRRTLETGLRRIPGALAPLSLPLVWLALQWVSMIAIAAADLPGRVLEIVVSLLTAWIIIRLSSNIVRDPVLARFIAITAWTIAALNIVGLLDPTIAVLDRFAVTLGELRISALSVIKGVISLAVLLWGAFFASQLLERRISRLPNLTPSVQVLFSKLLKIVLITLAVVAALSTVGIDLTAFALFSGAVGVGVGFGLQKVVSNLVSGVILLLDKSIKPGDVIAVSGTYGWINSLGARYVSVITRDGTEHLIPNEELITQRVENWSFSDNLVRLKAPIGISYHSDVHKAVELVQQAAAEVPRVLTDPAPRCLVVGFGDSSVDLELRFWIQDAQNGITNVKSEILLAVWDRFHEHGVEIPFPQRDLHLKSPGALDVIVRTVEDGAGAAA